MNSANTDKTSKLKEVSILKIKLKLKLGLPQGHKNAKVVNSNNHNILITI